MNLGTPDDPVQFSEDNAQETIEDMKKVILDHDEFLVNPSNCVAFELEPDDRRFMIMPDIKFNLWQRFHRWLGFRRYQTWQEILEESKDE